MLDSDSTNTLIPQITPMNAISIPLDTADFTSSPLLASPLARPLQRLAQDLGALLRDGHLQSVELDLKQADCPCFLLGVTSDKPQLYVELFWDDLEKLFQADEGSDLDTDPDNQERSLCVLMNWLGSDTDPIFWQAEGTAWEPDFGEVLSHILFMAQT